MRGGRKPSTPAIAEKAQRLLDWLALPGETRAEAGEQWRGEFVRDDGVPRGPTILVNAKLAKDRPDVANAVAAEQQRLRAGGVRRGDVVCAQLPNWWESVAIAHAVWDGHRYAEDLDDPRAADPARVPFRREVVALARD